MMRYYGGYGFMSGFDWLFMILFWIIVIWAIIAIVRWLSMGSHHGEHKMHGMYGMHGWHGQSDRSIQILNERYAKGEITKAQFEEMKKDLNQ